MYQPATKDDLQKRRRSPVQPKLGGGKRGGNAQWGVSRPLSMPEDVQAKMQSSFGYDFSNVQMSENSGVPQISNRALTTGGHVMFAPGAFQPHTHGGQELIGHELSHVVSQSRGEVSAPQGDSLMDSVVVDKALESRADSEGSRAASYSGEVKTSGLKSVSSGGGDGGGAVQGDDIDVDSLNVAHYGTESGPGSRAAHRQQGVDMARHTPERAQQTHNTVDSLNTTIGLTQGMFGTYSLSKGHRKQLREKVIVKSRQIRPTTQEDMADTSMTAKQREANAWIRWLIEPSRITALLMPEMNAAQCRKDRRLDRATDMITQGGMERDDATSEDVAGEHDEMSHHINSGQIDPTTGQPIMWHQEGHRSDLSRGFAAQHQNWSPALLDAHNRLVEMPPEADEGRERNRFVELAKNEAVRRTKKKGFFERQSTYAQRVQQAEAAGRTMGDKIVSETLYWNYRDVSRRFWRLTSLMGLDFFNNYQKTVIFTRAHGTPTFNSPNPESGRRAITDSEWQHANRMGYLNNPNSSIKHVQPTDRLIDRNHGLTPDGPIAPPPPQLPIWANGGGGYMGHMMRQLHSLGGGRGGVNNAA